MRALLRAVLMSVAVHSTYMGSKMVVSLLALDLGASPAWIGVLAMLYAAVPLAFSLHAGRMADTIGMRIPMLAGACCMGIAMLCGWVWHGLTGLLVVSTLAGTAFVLFNVSVQNLAGAIGSPEERARNFSVLSIGYAVSTFIGPTFAGLSIDHAGHTRTFLFFAGFALVPIVLLALDAGITRVHSSQPPPAGRRRVLDLLRSPPLRRMVVTSGLTVAAWELYGFYLPIYGHSIGLSASTIGMLLGTYAVANLVTRFALPALLRRFPPGHIMPACLGIAAAAFLALPVTESVYGLAALSFVIGLGLGCSQPLLMVMAFEQAPAGRTGEVTGLRLTANNTARVVIPLIAGTLGAAFGAAPVFWMNALNLALVSLLVRKR